MLFILITFFSQLVHLFIIIRLHKMFPLSPTEIDYNSYTHGINQHDIQNIRNQARELADGGKYGYAFL